MHVHELVSEHTTARVALDVGATIVDLTVDGRAVLWRQPPVRDPEPDEIPEPSTLAWMRGGVGGWELMAPNAGDAVTTPDGTFHPFHGVAGRSAWHAVSLGATELQATLDLPDHRVALRRTVSVTGRTCRVEEQLTNVGDRPLPVVWGSHLALGQDLLEGPRRIEVDGEVLGAQVDGASVEATEFRSLLAAPADGRQALGFVAAAEQIGHARLVTDLATAHVTWDAVTFPYLWIWIELSASAWPWSGRARAIGLEPVSSWPATGIEGVRASTGTHVDVEPGARHVAWVDLSVEPA